MVARDDRCIWGVSFGHHDAALTVVKNNELIYSSHSERYSKIKNDKFLHAKQFDEALNFGNPENVYYYENSKLKSLRKLVSGQWKNFYSNPAHEFSKTLNRKGLQFNFYEGNHHRSHAALGYYTSGFKDALIITCDAIGEFETLTVYKADNNVLAGKPVFKLSYPHSVGLFYSAVTKAIGLKPNEEEFIAMGMSSFGQPNYMNETKAMFMIQEEKFPAWKSLKEFHLGLDLGVLSFQQKADWASTAQKSIEDYILTLFKFLSEKFPDNKNWVFSGGVALNCKLNSKIAESLKQDSQLFIFPNPGDAGSSLGAILSATNTHIPFHNLYLGTPVSNVLNPKEIVKALLGDGVAGIVTGKAEFGPRALGNRSLLADPRSIAMKDTVNKIKKRDEFRPFAPVVPLELADEFFELPRIVKTSPYMQYLARVKKPEMIPAIKHIDGTARLQTLTREMNPLLHDVLMEWYKETNCPVLLNTSLNIKGQPLVNDATDARLFHETYGVKVFY